MAEPYELDLEVHEDPVHYVYLDLNATGRLVFSFAVVLHGWSLANPASGATAAANLYDGTDTTGQPIFPLSFADSESVGDWFGDRGILLKNGLYVNVTSGEVKGAIFYRRHRG